MRYALIKNGLVDNVVEVETITTAEAVAAALANGELPVGYVVPDGFTAVEAPADVGPGYTYDGETFSPPPEPEPPAPVFPDISDRQFYQALSLPPYSIITRAEALAAVKVGDLPASLQAIVDAIPDEDTRYNAEMLLSGAKQFERSHPMVAAIAGAMPTPWSGAEVNAFWAFARSL
ncbi:hypothetical protein ACJ4V0_15555 [Phreatobacter sp. HK31-P]